MPFHASRCRRVLVQAIPGVYDVWLGGVGPGKQGVFVDDAEVQAPLHASFTVV